MMSRKAEFVRLTDPTAIATGGVESGSVSLKARS
jgi:hypothetical protein